MQKSWYEDILPCIGGHENVEMLMTDTGKKFFYIIMLIIICEKNIFTDSLCFQVFGMSSNYEVLHSLSKIMDYSNLGEDHPLYDPSRKNELGYFKSEISGTATGFAGCKAKSYSIKTLENPEGEMTKAKGVNKFSQKNLKFDHYKRVIFSDRAEHIVNQYSLQSKNYINRLVEMNRVAFSSLYDTRFLMCPVHSIPYHSWQIDEYLHSGKCTMCKMDDNRKKIQNEIDNQSLNSLKYFDPSTFDIDLFDL